MAPDLGQHKDLFEKALEKLGLVLVENQGTQAQTKGLMEKPGKKEEIDEAIRRSEKNGKELEASVAALQDGKKGLFNILKTWEDEWKKRIEGIDIPEAGDKIRYQEILKEKEELMAQVDKLEKQLKEKGDLLEKTKAQYSNLEKEYSILYRQQQEQKQDQKQEPEQKQDPKQEPKQELKQEQKKDQPKDQ
jgi:peptidoglycan hydrolase CwlO-like protein